jgi:hypothetical protein
MKNILAIDPGSVQSGVVTYDVDKKKVLYHAKLENKVLIQWLHRLEDGAEACGVMNIAKFGEVCIERIEAICYTTALHYEDLYETARMEGMLHLSLRNLGAKVSWKKRQNVILKLAQVTGSACPIGNRDAWVRQVLIDAGHIAKTKSKANTLPWMRTTDERSAFAIALTHEYGTAERAVL